MTRPRLTDLYRPSLALLTDLYQLTMACGYWHAGLAEREAVFHLFFRTQPFAGGYAIACGLASNKDLVGRSAYDFVMWFGSVTLTAGFLFVGCCRALASPTKPAVAAATDAEPLARAA